MVVPVASENVSASQLQHYVPRFLLRRFADVQNGRVHVFDKHTDAAFIANPNKVAAKNGLYSFKFIGHDMTLEPALAELEGRAAPHVARILQDRRLHPEDALERVELARFFAVQLVRTPAHRETWRDLWTRMETWLREQGMPDDYFQPDPKIGSGEHAERALAARMISTAPQTMAPALMDKDWLLLATDAGHPFLLGDHPLAMHNDVDRGLRGNLGLNVEGIELYFPLSPRLALAMVCRSRHDELVKGIERLDRLAEARSPIVAEFRETWSSALDIVEAMQAGQPLRSSPANVEFFNSLQISTAERFIFSNGRDFTLAREMIEANPELRRGRRMEEVTGKSEVVARW